MSLELFALGQAYVGAAAAGEGFSLPIYLFIQTRRSATGGGALVRATVPLLLLQSLQSGHKFGVDVLWRQ